MLRLQNACERFTTKSSKFRGQLFSSVSVIGFLRFIDKGNMIYQDIPVLQELELPLLNNWCTLEKKS